MHNSVLGQVLPEATHEVVLGDLFGSQWIPDEEFLQRVPVEVEAVTSEAWVKK